MNHEIIYEFPLNERIRVFIRLEQLFLQLDHFLAGQTAWDRRSAISTLINILNIFSRNDIKTEILKELDRHTTKFKQIQQLQKQENEKLDKLLKNLTLVSNKLYNSGGKIGVSTMKCSLFQDISQRSTIPGGTCSFDLPGFHYWLEQHEHIQAKNLKIWTEPFIYLRHALTLILKTIRKSSIPDQKSAVCGFYQSSLKSTMPYQLLRVGVDKSINCFAEISGSKHRYTIRFMVPAELYERPKQSDEIIPFSLCCCLF